MKQVSMSSWGKAASPASTRPGSGAHVGVTPKRRCRRLKTTYGAWSALRPMTSVWSYPHGARRGAVQSISCASLPRKAAAGPFDLTLLRSMLAPELGRTTARSAASTWPPQPKGRSIPQRQTACQPCWNHLNPGTVAHNARRAALRIYRQIKHIAELGITSTMGCPDAPDRPKRFLAAAPT